MSRTAPIKEILKEAALAQNGGWLIELENMEDGEPQAMQEDVSLHWRLMESRRMAESLPALPPQVPMIVVFLLFRGVRRPGDPCEMIEKVAHELGIFLPASKPGTSGMDRSST